MMYLPSNPITELLRGLFKRRVGDATLGYLGDTHGAGARVDVPGMPGFVYVHFPNGRDAAGNARYSEPTIARSGNAAYQNFPGAGVYVGYGYDGDLEIKGAQYKAMDQAGINTATLNPLNQQSKFVYEWQLTYGLASSVGNTAVPSTLVTVKSFRHYVGDTFQTFETPLEADKIDLAASVPADDMQRLAALWLDTYTNTIEVTESTAQSIDDPLDATDVQELVADRPPDAMPLKAFRLADGQVSIQQNPTTETSLRQHMATPALLGFPQVLDTRERVRPNRTFMIPGDSSVGAGSLTLETGARLLRVHKNNVTNTAPTVNDDSGDGYSIGSLWFDTATGLLYVASNVTVGAAVWEEVASSSGGAPADATYIVQVADADLPNAQAMGALATGLVKNTTTTGVQSIALAETDYVTPSGAGTLSNKTLTTPTIGDFTNAQHNHSNAAGGGNISGSAFAPQTAGTFFTGPAAGGAATPAFRAMVSSDIPAGVGNKLDINITFGETITTTQAIYYQVSDGRWYKLSNVYSANRVGPMRGVALSGGNAGQTGSARIMGLSSLSFGTSSYGMVYADSTNGALTQSEPTPTLGGDTVVIVQMGYNTPAGAYINGVLPVRYLRRASLADDATLSLTHYADNTTHRVRKLSAFISAEDVSLLETSGGAQDSSRQLKGQSGAGTTTTVTNTSTVTFALGDSGGNDFKVAQSFTVTAAGQLSSFTVNFGATTGTPVGSVTWALRDDNAGIPGAILSTGTMGTITASADNTVSGIAGAFVNTATTYWLTLEMAAQATNNFYTVSRNNANPYANGLMKCDSSASPGTWAALAAGSDMRCAITVTAVVANDGLAQGVSHASTAPLSYADVLLKKTGSPAGTLTLAVYSDTGGFPNAVITNGTATTISATSLTTGYTLIRFTWPVAPSITASTQYHLVLTTSDSASNTAYVEWGIDQSSPPYAGGAFAQLQSAAWGATSPAADGIFDLYGVTTTYGASCVPGFWISTNDDMVARYDDGAGSNATTQTTFKNTSGVTLDTICSVEMP